MMYKQRMPPHRRYNRYQDIEIDAAQLPHGDMDEFLSALKREESMWMDRIRTKTSDLKFLRFNALFWLRVPTNLTHLLPVLLVATNFKVHHATGDYIMVVKSSNGNTSISNTPAYGTHYARIECMVVDKDTKCVLMVKEYIGTTECKRKFVTGSIDVGEHPSEAAVREVMEETGVMTKFIGVIGVVSRLGTRFGRDEILIGCLLEGSQTITPTPKPGSSEIKTVEWVPMQNVMSGESGRMAREWSVALSNMFMYPGPLEAEDIEDFRGNPYLMRIYTKKQLGVGVPPHTQQVSQ